MAWPLVARVADKDPHAAGSSLLGLDLGPLDERLQGLALQSVPLLVPAPDPTNLRGPWAARRAISGHDEPNHEDVVAGAADSGLELFHAPLQVHGLVRGDGPSGRHSEHLTRLVGRTALGQGQVGNVVVRGTPAKLA